MLLVTEGIPDALTAASAGYAAVGILGSQAPDDRVADALVHHAESTGRALVAIVDADPAGRAWGERLGQLLASRSRRLDRLEPPGELDLNSWAKISPDWTTHMWANLDQRSLAAGPGLDHASR